MKKMHDMREMHRALTAKAALAAILVVIAIAGCSDAGTGSGTTVIATSAATSTANKRTTFLTPCRVKGIEIEVRCGVLSVAENRQDTNNNGRKIGINIVVLPASARVKEPDPIFLFAGGPGQAAASLAPQAMMLLGGLNNKRDLVLIDQRGTGKSNGLICKLPNATEAAMANLSQFARDEKMKQATIECRDVLSKNADLTQYTTTIAMADYDEVRAALGYDKINLWGASYGTRSSMEYLRRYPDHVRSVVIDGVAPPSMALPLHFGRDAGAAYEKVLSSCEAEPTCNKNFPALRQQVDSLSATLAKAPRKVMLADSVTGIATEVEVTREMLLISIFSTLYVPEMAAQLPAALSRAAGGDYAMLATLSGALSDMAEEQVTFGMRMSVMCAEDLPRIKPADLEREANRPPFNRLFIDEFAKSCAIWPKGTMAADFDQPVKSDKPVLILSGGLDPVTPPVHGEEVKQSLSNAVHLIAPNVGHGVSHKGCAPKIVKKFIESASVAGLDGECLKRMPRPMFYEPLQEKKSTGEHRVQTATNASDPAANESKSNLKGKQQ